MVRVSIVSKSCYHHENRMTFGFQIYWSNILFLRFNYRSTHYMAMNGYYNFLNWFDDRAWYPLGRIVGGTVSCTYYIAKEELW